MRNTAIQELYLQEPYLQEIQILTKIEHMHESSEDYEWVERHPQQCSNGHKWDKPGTFLVGYHSPDNDTPRRTWWCQSCKDVIYAHKGANLLHPQRKAPMEKLTLN